MELTAPWTSQGRREAPDTQVFVESKQESRKAKLRGRGRGGERGGGVKGT